MMWFYRAIASVPRNEKTRRIKIGRTGIGNADDAGAAEGERAADAERESDSPQIVSAVLQLKGGENNLAIGRGNAEGE